MTKPAAQRFLSLYPRAWRERYGEEFLELATSGRLRVQQVIDIVSGAIDAWLSADVREATQDGRVVAPAGGPTMLRSMMACERRQVRATPRDGLIGAAVMIGTSLVFSGIGMAARHYDWPVTAKVVMGLSFLGPFTLSMPFWLMKGQPWRAQVAIVGFTFAVLVVMSVFAGVN